MSNKTFNIIYKTLTIVLAIMSFVGAISVWFFNYQESTFGIGFNYFFIGIMATLFALAKITNTKN